MKKFLFITSVSFSLFITSCSEINNPPENNQQFIPVGGCTTEGLEIGFADTCTYNFIIEFINGLDSISVKESFLGALFYFYTDSGSYQFWQDYFIDDPTIENVDAIYPDTDSMIIVIKVSGLLTVEQETQRLSQIKHLQFYYVTIFNRSLILDVPEKKEEYWKQFFEQYSFIKFANILVMCTDS